MLEPRLHERALFLFEETELKEQTAVAQLEQLLDEEIGRPFDLGGASINSVSPVFAETRRLFPADCHAPLHYRSAIQGTVGSAAFGVL